MFEYEIKYRTFDQLFPKAPLHLEPLKNGELITQAKWEDREDRISSCYPAAVLNAAILTGSLSVDVAHAVHERILELPDNWVRTPHPDPDIDHIKGWNLQAQHQEEINYDISDVLYQIYAKAGERKAFHLRQLLHKHLGIIALREDGLPETRPDRFIWEAVRRTPLVTGHQQHAQTVVRTPEGLVSLNPRHPHDPEAIDCRYMAVKWYSEDPQEEMMIEAVVTGPDSF